MGQTIPHFPMKKQRLPFDSEWKEKPFKLIKVNLHLNPTPNQETMLLEILNGFKKAVNDSLEIIHDKYNNQEISLDDLKPKRAKFPDDFTRELMPKFQERFGWNKQAPAKAISFKAIEMYSSRAKRFKKKSITSPPKIKNGKSIQIQSSGVVKISNDIFSYYLKDNEWLSIPFTIPEAAQWKIETLKRNYSLNTKGEWFKGGNLIRYNSGRWEYVMVLLIDFEWAYLPQASLGIDLNRHKDNSIVFSQSINEKIKLSLSPACQNAIQGLNELNKEWKEKYDRKFPSERLTQARRSAIRFKIQRKHAHFLKIIRPIVDSWFPFIKENRFLLCIDNLTAGANMGSFGHDKIIKYLQKRCYEERIPFVLVPTAYTSQMCLGCDAQLDRETHDKTQCPNCHSAFDAHISGAKNIARFGLIIWKEGLKDFYTWRSIRTKGYMKFNKTKRGAPLTFQEFSYQKAKETVPSSRL